MRNELKEVLESLEKKVTMLVSFVSSMCVYSILIAFFQMK